MAGLLFELICPQQIPFQGEVDAVVLPGVEGEMTILPQHTPLVTPLEPGLIEIEMGVAGKQRAFVSRAVAEIAASAVTVLAEVAVMFEELTSDQVDDEISRQRALMDEATEGMTRSRAAAFIWRLEEIKGMLRF